MSAISLRLPESLHKKAREIAAEENVSINQLIAVALAEKISALSTADYLAARGARGDRAAFEKALSHVADRAPAEHDALPS